MKAVHDDSFEIWIERVYAELSGCEPEQRCACPSCFYALQQRRGRWLDADRVELRRRVQAQADELERLPMTAAFEDLVWLKHSLPWLLELLARHSHLDATGAFRQSVFRSLRDHRWRSWPTGQVDAIDRALICLWEAALVSWRPEDLLLDLSLLQDDVTSFLDAWLRTSDSLSIQCLMGFICDHAIPLAAGGSLPHPCTPAATHQIARWIGEDRTLAALEDLGMRADVEVFDDVAFACEMLRWIRGSEDRAP